MDVVGRKVENQVQFWSLLGPCFVLLSIAVLLFKVSDHWYFPISALIGIPLCVKWKMRGMAIALGCLLFLTGMGYQNLELDDRYWHVGLSLTMAFSFIVLTLSLEEAQGLVNKLQLESQSRLDNFSLLDEKWKTAETEWTIEADKYTLQMANLSQELAKTQEDKHTFYKLAQLAKDELVYVKEQHDLLLQDLFYKKQQIAQLNERLEETELTIQGFVDSDAEKQMQLLTNRLTQLESQKEIIQSDLNSAYLEKQNWQKEKEQLSQDLKLIQEKENIYLSEQQQIQQIQIDQQNVLQTLQAKCTSLEEEKKQLHQSQTNLQLQFEQVRQLENQHRQSVLQGQRRIQELETKLNLEDQQKNLLQTRIKELQEQTLRYESQLKQKDEQYQQALQQNQEHLEIYKQQSYNQLEQTSEKIKQQNQKEKEVLEQEIQKAQIRYQEAQIELDQLKNEFKANQEALIHAQHVQAELKMQQIESEKQLKELLEHVQQQSKKEQEKLIQDLQTVQEHARDIQEKLKKANEEIETKGLILAESQDLQVQLQKQQIEIERQTKQLVDKIQQQHQCDQDVLKNQLKETQTSYQKIQEEYSLLQKTLLIKEEDLKHTEQKFNQLNQELYQQQQLVQQGSLQLQQLEELKTHLEKKLQHAQHLSLQEPKTIEKSVSSQHARRVEGMYLQLKEQFQEKCQVLDDTRRELFRTNEELLKKQKEYEEDQIFDLSISEQILQKHLVQLTEQYEEMQKQYEKEIEDLSSFVDCLLIR